MRVIINNQKFNLIIANSFIKKLIGLVGKKEIINGMFFPKTRSIHTFFMKSNIDIVMINKENKVVYFKKDVKKNKIIIKKKAYSTIELPPNSLNKITTGDELIFN